MKPADNSNNLEEYFAKIRDKPAQVSHIVLTPKEIESLKFLMQRRCYITQENDEVISDTK